MPPPMALFQNESSLLGGGIGIWALAPSSSTKDVD